MSEQRTPDEVENRVCDAIASLGPPRDDVKRDAVLEDLDIDSLDMVELAQIVEDEYDVAVETQDFKGVETVGQAVDVILAKMAPVETRA